MVPIHPAAQVMPQLPDSEYQALRADIETNGQLVPVLLLDGQVIDGRHRMRACLELGLTVEYEEIELQDITPGQLVWSLNGQRRHLKPSVRAAIFAELCGEQEEQAAKKRLATKSQHVANLPQAEKGTAREAIAKLADVSPRTVQDVRTVQKHAPELLPEIKAGKVTASAAAKQIRENAKPKPPKNAPPADKERTPPGTIPTADEAVACVMACEARMVVMRRVIEQLPAEMLIPILDMINDRLEQEGDQP